MESLFREVLPIVPVVVLLSARVGAALAALPQPLGAGAPTPVRAALSLLIAMAIAAPYHGAIALPLEPVALAVAGFGEVLVGGAIGLVARAVLSAADAAGEVAGNAMGLGFASTVDPNSGEQAQIPAQILGALAVAIFFAMRGHHAVLIALAHSIEVAPPGDVMAALASEGVVSIGADVVAQGLRIASPVVATMLVVQVALGLAARAAPRLQVFQLSFAAAASVGLLTLVVAAPSLAEALAAGVGELPERLEALLAR